MSETKSDTHIKQETKDFVYFNLYVFRQKMERQNILNWMTESTSKFDLLNFFAHTILIKQILKNL
jgi:hypothetical protein